MNINSGEMINCGEWSYTIRDYNTPPLRRYYKELKLCMYVQLLHTPEWNRWSPAVRSRRGEHWTNLTRKTVIEECQCGAEIPAAIRMLILLVDNGYYMSEPVTNSNEEVR